MNIQDAEKIVTEKSDDELLAILAHSNDWQPQILDAAKAMLQKRGVEFSPVFPQAHQAEPASGKHKSEALAGTSLILGTIGALLIFIGVISRGFNFSIAPAGILGGFLGLIAFFIGIIAVYRKGNKSRAATGIVTGGLAVLPFLLTLLPSSHILRTLSHPDYDPQISSHFWIATVDGDLEKVRTLLKVKPDLAFEKDSDGKTTLRLAEEYHQKNVMELLLANKADVNAKDNNGQTPLHWAAFAGDEDMVKLLLANKADVNAKDKDGNTPLHQVVAWGNKDLAELLLANNADVNAKDINGNTPMDIAVLNDNGLNNNGDVAQLLHQHGGQDYFGEIIEAVKQGDLEKIKALLKDNPYLVFNKDDYGKTPLHWAASKNVGELLVSNHANVNAKDNHGETPLLLAAIAGNEETAELLLANGADVNAKDNNGQTPLHQAATHGNKDMAILLLANKADINAKDSNNQNPLQLAARGNHDDMAELLLQRGGHDLDFEIRDSAQRGDLKKVKSLIEEHPNLVSSTDNLGNTPLHIAALMGHKDVAELLLAKKADVNAKDDNGDTPLHSASERGHMDVVELLLTNGAGVNAKDNFGETPLHKAANSGLKDVSELLLANKADINAKDHNGDTPLHMAESMGKFFGRDKDVAELLRQHGGQE